MLPVNPASSQPVVKDTAPAPFSSVLGMSILFTPLAGGLMAAINWRRFGKPSKGFQALLLGIFGLLLSIAVSVYLQAVVTASRVLIIVVVLALNLVFGLILSEMQRSDYKRWIVEHGGKAPSLVSGGCLMGIAIIIGATALRLVITSMLVPIAMNVFSHSQPAVIYTDGSVTLTRPSGWLAMNVSDVGSNLCTNNRCLLGGIQGDDLQFIFRQYNGADYTSLSPQAVDNAVWAGLQRNTPTASVVSAQVLKVDGRDAYQRVYMFSAPGFLTVIIRIRMLLFVKEDTGSILRLDVGGSQTAYNNASGDIAAVINGIHFAAK